MIILALGLGLAVTIALCTKREEKLERIPVRVELTKKNRRR